MQGCGKDKLARSPVCKLQAANVEISNAPDGFIPTREFCNFLRLLPEVRFEVNYPAVRCHVDISVSVPRYAFWNLVVSQYGWELLKCGVFQQLVVDAVQSPKNRPYIRSIGQWGTPLRLARLLLRNPRHMPTLGHDGPPAFWACTKVRFRSKQNYTHPGSTMSRRGRERRGRIRDFWNRDPTFETTGTFGAKPS